MSNFFKKFLLKNLWACWWVSNGRASVVLDWDTNTVLTPYIVGKIIETILIKSVDTNNA